MSSFTIRVELHDANWQHYTDLANDLARKGVTDLITSSDGVSYKMSPGEYNYEGNATIDDVLTAVRESANKTGRANAVFVTEAVRRKWIGLPQAQSRRTA
jgi:preprotein translocase subunit SecD